ncbi:MAG: hypothetical protein R3F56_18920 [Planctomycetota bacterium]
MRLSSPPGLVCACAVVGACLVAFPWLDRPQPRSLPQEWGVESRTHALVNMAAGAVDRACRDGDLVGLRNATSSRYLGVLHGLLARDGRRLDAESLRQQKVHVGGIAQLPLLVGLGAADAAVAVFARERAGFEFEAEANALLALRFTWDGFTLRLDDKVGRTVPPGQSLTVAARALARELLAGR